ncbi:MAG TPA: tetratricopeptide repeat protein, partial [Solirubrobacteraceae bacterium]|nr:tetratricopeptide repeat protein [Solirubrobacteraceae bacterium]
MSEHFGERFRELIEHAAESCESGDLAAAAETLWTVLERDQASAPAWELLAYVELGRRRWEDARSAATRAVALTPEEPYGHVVAAIALLMLKRTEEALAQAREAVRLDPDDWRNLDLLARALLENGGDGVEEARAVAGRMRELAPAEPRAHMFAGRLAVRAGDDDDARAAFRETLAVDPDNAGAHHALAGMRLRRRLNDPAVLAEAAAGFARAAAVEPENARGRQALELLIRVALSKASYLLMLDAFLINRVASHSEAPGARLLAPLLLLLPLYYGVRFWARATEPVRSQVRATIRERRSVLMATRLELAAGLGIIASALVAQSARDTAAALAGACALAGRWTLSAQVRRTAREPRAS